MGGGEALPDHFLIDTPLTREIKLKTPLGLTPAENIWRIFQNNITPDQKLRAKRAKIFGFFGSLLAVLQGKIDQKGVQKKYNFYNPPANNWPKKFQNNITPFQHLADLIVKGGGLTLSAWYAIVL